MLSKFYLLLYNLACASGWATVLYLVADHHAEAPTDTTLWSVIAKPLTYVQTAAVLEILHSLIGLVRSPIMTTFMQVASRIIVLWGATILSPAAQADEMSLKLMVVSWCLVEVPRYLFYATNLFASGLSMPYPLFWLRYSLFMVLYPSGITGELLQFWASFPDVAAAMPMLYRFVLTIFCSYAFAGPFMVLNMWGNRKRSFRRRAQLANPRPLKGLVWPVQPRKGDRGTTETNRDIISTAIAAVDEDQGKRSAGERNWRFGYTKHLEASVRLSLQSRDNALEIARAGLDRAHDMFEFVRDGKTVPFREAMDGDTFPGKFDTHTIHGEGKRPAGLEVPYGMGGKARGLPYYEGRDSLMSGNAVLRGEALAKQLNEWVEYGTVEGSAAEAIRMVSEKGDEWLDLSDRNFVLLGATSAMGPLEILLAHGANVIAVDINRPHVWMKLFNAVRGSPGTLTFPLPAGTPADELENMDDKAMAAIAGCNLLEDTPEIANWLVDLHPEDEFMVGNYTYLDGGLHVQLALACDAIMARLLQEREEPTGLAFLCTPTDALLCPKEAHDAAAGRPLGGTSWMRSGLFNLVRNVRPPVETTDGNGTLYYVDGQSVNQGPNYILAKRLQHWRAILAHAEGCTVSTNVAPSTATLSVVHNKQFAAAYGGMHLFPPMEVMYQETSLAVMGALLIHDVRNPDGIAQRGEEIAENKENPHLLFGEGSFHGGVWRCSYTIGTIGVPSAVSFYLRTYSVPIMATLVAVPAWGAWLVGAL